MRPNSLSDYVRELAFISADDWSSVGWKAANLGSLIALSLPVPCGYCITVAAFREANNIWLSSNVRNAVTAGKILLSEIQNAVVKAPMPSKVADSITLAYQQLSISANMCNVPVAIRSSSVAEDTQQASFAGQFDTFLGIVGPESVLMHVKRCWASFFSERGQLYAHLHNINLWDYGMAVIVQRMVDAEKSGVAFTAHPVTGDESVIAIETIWGLGQRLVSGHVTPDTILVRKADFKVIDERIAMKTHALRLAPTPTEGVCEVEVPLHLRNVRCLADQEIRELSEICIKIERAHRCAQDIEWAIDGKKIYILQARPMTGLRLL